MLLLQLISRRCVYLQSGKIRSEPWTYIDSYIYRLKRLTVSLFLSHSLTTSATSATSSPVSLHTPAPPFPSQISPPSPTTLPPSPSFSVPPLDSNSGGSTEKVSCPLKMSPSALVVRYVRNSWFGSVGYGYNEPHFKSYRVHSVFPPKIKKRVGPRPDQSHVMIHWR